MIACTNCGEQNPARQILCWACGNLLSPVAQPSPPNSGRIDAVPPPSGGTPHVTPYLPHPQFYPQPQKGGPPPQPAQAQQTPGSAYGPPPQANISAPMPQGPLTGAYPQPQNAAHTYPHNIGYAQHAAGNPPPHAGPVLQGYGSQPTAHTQQGTYLPPASATQPNASTKTGHTRLRLPKLVVRTNGASTSKPDKAPAALLAGAGAVVVALIVVAILLFMSMRNSSLLGTWTLIGSTALATPTRASTGDAFQDKQQQLLDVFGSTMDDLACGAFAFPQVLEFRNDGTVIFGSQSALIGSTSASYEVIDGNRIRFSLEGRGSEVYGYSVSGNTLALRKEGCPDMNYSK